MKIYSLFFKEIRFDFCVFCELRIESWAPSLFQLKFKVKSSVQTTTTTVKTKTDTQKNYRIYKINTQTKKPRSLDNNTQPTK